MRNETRDIQHPTHALRRFPIFIIPMVLLGLALLMLMRVDEMALMWDLEDSEKFRHYWRLIWLTIAWIAGGWWFNRLLKRVVWDGLLAHAIGAPVPGALKALSTVMVCLILATFIVGFVYEQSITAFLAALGAGGVVLGFALRDLLYDVFIGLAINVDRTFVIGDWIQINEGVSGYVVAQINEIGWRATSLTTEEKTSVLVPNGVLGRERMTNITRPLVSTRYELTVSVEYSVSPSRVKRVLKASMMVLQQMDGFDSEKTPVVLVKDTSALGVEYLMRFWILPWHPISPTSAIDRVLENALKDLHTAGIALAYPKADVFTAKMPVRQFDSHHQRDLMRLLADIDLFEPLSGEDLEIIVDAMERRRVSPGEVLFRQGDTGKSLFILIEGLLDVELASENQTRRVAQIQPGECFGEMSLLTGDRRSATIRAASESVVYMVGKKPIRRIMTEQPVLLETLSRVLADRQRLTEQTLNDVMEHVQNDEIEGFARQLVLRMRNFLDIHLHDSEQKDRT